MVLRLNGLEAGYGSKTVISGVSFALEPGQILAFLGHNGAGKTTTLKSVMGMLRPSAGEVLFDGERIDRLSVAERVALGLRLLPEGRGIFPDLSVGENVQLSVRSRRGLNGAMRISAAKRQEITEEAAALLAQVGLAGRERTRAGTLAHGNQRALDIAIGLALRPKAILMDEPMSGMSKGDRGKMAALIVRLRDEFGLTILLVEHDIDLVRMACSAVTVLDFGEVIASGAPAVVLADEAVVKAYLGVDEMEAVS